MWCQQLLRIWVVALKAYWLWPDQSFWGCVLESGLTRLFGVACWNLPDFTSQRQRWGYAWGVITACVYKPYDLWLMVLGVWGGEGRGAWHDLVWHSKGGGAGDLGRQVRCLYVYVCVLRWESVCGDSSCRISEWGRLHEPFSGAVICTPPRLVGFQVTFLTLSHWSQQQACIPRVFLHHSSFPLPPCRQHRLAHTHTHTHTHTRTHAQAGTHAQACTHAHMHRLAHMHAILKFTQSHTLTHIHTQHIPAGSVAVSAVSPCAIACC